MRNRISGIMQALDGKWVFTLYEISDAFDHHHKVVYRQELEPNEIKELIQDLNAIPDRLQTPACKHKGQYALYVQKYHCRECGKMIEGQQE